jgi:TonB family protein
VRLLASLILLTAPGLFAQDPVDFTGWMNRGVAEFKAANYPQAAAAFDRAAAIDPSSVQARLYLGTALLQQFIPGVDTPENRSLAESARRQFLQALDLDRSNSVAMASLGSLSLNQKKWDDAQQWYEKLIAADPANAGAWYSLGFIAWSKWYPAYGQARAGLGMRQDQPGPIPDAAVRADLTARFGGALDAGIHAFTRALEIDPTSADAMAYMNLLIRERADLRSTAEDYRGDIAAADQWVERALAAKKQKAEQAGRMDAPLAAVVPPPPPPPPPPARPPERITLDPDVVERQRVHYVAPSYPPLALQSGIQGTVHFMIAIGRDGRMVEIKVISGHPLLIPPAIAAVRQWEYKPTLLNGQPVEVQTEAWVNFSLDPAVIKR